jgi:hypothetical protein
VRFLTANKDKNFVKSHGREPDKFIKKQGENVGMGVARLWNEGRGG